MTGLLPNPFVFHSAAYSSPADQLAAHAGHAAVLSIPQEASGTARKAPSGSVLAGPSRYAPEIATVAVKQQDMIAPETGRGEAEHSSRLVSFPMSDRASESTAGSSASTLSCLEPLTAAWVFGCIRAELSILVDAINSQIALRTLASNSINSFSRS